MVVEKIMRFLSKTQHCFFMLNDDFVNFEEINLIGIRKCLICKIKILSHLKACFFKFQNGEKKNLEIWYFTSNIQVKEKLK